MRRLPFSASIAVTALAISAGLAAARSDDRPSPMAFEALDTNSDGQISREEMTAQRTAHMARADSNGDGLLSAEELQAHAAERATRKVEKMIERFDSNNDGQLSSEELTENQRMPRHFRRADRDGDGSLSREEFDAARDRMAKRRHSKD